MSAHQDSAAPVAWLYRSDAGDKELILDCNGEHARRLIELGWTEAPLYDRPTTLREQRDELLEALVVADDAIREMFRYYDGGETRGSYDGKPERAQLRKAGYSTSAAIAKARS